MAAQPPKFPKRKRNRQLLSFIQLSVMLVLATMTVVWIYIVTQYRKPTQSDLHPINADRLIRKPPLRKPSVAGNKIPMSNPEIKPYAHEKVGDGDDDDDNNVSPDNNNKKKKVQEAAVSSAADPPGAAAKTSTSRHITSKEFLKKSIFKKEAHHEQVVKKDKKGNILHNAIHAVKKEDLEGLHIKLPDNWESMTMEQAVKGREPLVDILHDAGVDEMDVAAVLSLPKWETVTKLYGSEGPVVIGLETCEQFQKTIPLDKASIGIAGMFNTGTNPLNMYLEENCIMPNIKHERHGGMRFQVPWGKHVPASWKWNNTAGNDNKTNKTDVLPVVMVRDPYSWMQSMCKHPYTAKWTRGKDHCPGLVPTLKDKARGNNGSDTLNVTVKYREMAYFDSLADYWTEWYEEYLHADYPRLMVRFEDLQFHAREMVDAICQCAGAVPRDKSGGFSYVVDSAKSFGPGHGGNQQPKTNMVSAMIKYGSDEHRFDGLTKEDMKFAATHLSPELMKLFDYNIPDVPESI